MLDVHVLTGSAPKSWLDQCLASIFEARSKAPFRVDVHVLAGEVGHIGRGRAAGYAMGTQPYVTFVDDDDYLMPEAFSCMAEALSKSPRAIFTREMCLQNGILGKTDRRHHLAVYRREDVSTFDFEAWPAYDAMALRTFVEDKGGEIIDLPDAVYVYRLYGNSKARQIQRQYPDLLRLARG